MRSMPGLGGACRIQSEAAGTHDRSRPAAEAWGIGAFMIFDTKIVIAVRDDIATWQKLNVTAFLAGGLAGAEPELAGEPYRDASGTGYGPLIRQPILVFTGSADDLKAAYRRAL